MRIRSALILLAVAGSVHANDSINVGHRTDSSESKPMAWSIQLLEKAQDVFDKRMQDRAPGATMSFRLPKVDPEQGGNQVEIVGAGHHVPLPMTSNTTFSLKRGTLAEDSDAMVVVNRNFPMGEYNHPLVKVCSPGLPDGVQRMGDLRLACGADGNGEGGRTQVPRGAGGGKPVRLRCMRQAGSHQARRAEGRLRYRDGRGWQPPALSSC